MPHSFEHIGSSNHGHEAPHPGQAEQENISEPNQKQNSELLEDELESLGKDLDALKGAIDNVDEAKMTPEQQTVFQQAKELALNLAGNIESFLRRHDRIASTVVIAAAAGSAILLGNSATSLGVITERFTAFSDYHFTPNPGELTTAASNYLAAAKVFGAAISAFGAVGAFAYLLHTFDRD